MADPTAPQPAGNVLPVVIRSSVPATDNGVYVLARVDAPSVGLPISYLVLDPKTGQIALMAPCGCSTYHHLGSLIVRLAEQVAGAHPQGDGLPGPSAPCLH